MTTKRRAIRTEKQERDVIFAIWDLDILIGKCHLNKAHKREWDEKFSTLLSLISGRAAKQKIQNRK